MSTRQHARNGAVAFERTLIGWCPPPGQPWGRGTHQRARACAYFGLVDRRALSPTLPSAFHTKCTRYIDEYIPCPTPINLGVHPNSFTSDRAGISGAPPLQSHGCFKHHSSVAVVSSAPVQGVCCNCCSHFREICSSQAHQNNCCFAMSLLLASATSRLWVLDKRAAIAAVASAAMAVALGSPTAVANTARLAVRGDAEGDGQARMWMVRGIHTHTKSLNVVHLTCLPNYLVDGAEPRRRARLSTGFQPIAVHRVPSSSMEASS